jgi:hypothetical protein
MNKTIRGQDDLVGTREATVVVLALFTNNRPDPERAAAVGIVAALHMSTKDAGVLTLQPAPQTLQELHDDSPVV